MDGAWVVGGRFVLLDRIGAGATSRVRRAYDRVERRYCAAKLVRCDGRTSVLRVVREQALRLAHPHVVTPYASCMAGEDVLLAMDLVSGGSLETLLGDYGRLPPEYAAEVLDQMLAALGRIHRAGIVHRDVKPANLLLEPSPVGAPHVRLADFGIALGDDDVRFTTTGFAVGTPGYLAPEVLDRDRPGPRQDLYAAGMVGWRMLTGAGDPAPRQRIGERPAGVPPMLWTVLSHLCDPDPARRFASADAARRALAPHRSDLRFPALTVDGEPLQIFDHLGAPPAHAR
ncbi:serine/threonine-protein kinase [Actinomadura verrucosospora]|uniref:non-specific serine/threonine protein kinase n=1 Tax=Actinomadura verrucosospora TaxID=46165 RepID=A0A7D3VYG5_ACTVE|nr:serine/threonine-protein kinase [Actinomadura verrucosospora]QKG22056.1 serine/threonine protein kinase [Actinomadura verrucosospora]